jgi:hypothetical protein
MIHPLDESKPLPFRPGEGPFHIKGVAYRGHLDYVAEHVPGGVEEMLGGFRDPALVEFFGQKFLPSSYYDIIPLIAAGYVCARQSRKAFSEFVRVRTRYQAQKDIGGIYRMLLKLVSPMSAIERLPALMAQYFDFASDRQFEKLDAKKVELSCRGIPELLAPWFAVVMETYVEVVLTGAGGRSVLTRVTTPHEPDGDVKGVPAIKWRCQVSWD